MPEKRHLCLALLVALVPVALHGAERTYPKVEKYATEIQQVKIPIQEAVNQAMERLGGIPVGASLQRDDEDDDTWGFWIEMVFPPKDGKPASILGMSVDAAKGDVLDTEDLTANKERELRVREGARAGKAQAPAVDQAVEADKAAPGKCAAVEEYIRKIQKVQLPIQEAIGKAVEEYNGIVISTSLEASDQAECGFVFWVDVLVPPKGGKPARVWSITLDGETGDLLSFENTSRQKEEELAEIEKAREQDRREQEEERKKDEQARQGKNGDGKR